MITIACVRTGQKYGPEYVDRLRAMVDRHLPVPHRFVCLTDQKDLPQGVEHVDVRDHGLHGWWAKMLLLDPATRADWGRTIYLDLDTVIVGDLTPLAEWCGDFAICANFTRESNIKTWPCRYGSCVMSIAPTFGRTVYEAFEADREGWIRKAGNKGDQWVIERLFPKASLLQMAMPAGFFVHWRKLADHPSAPPDSAALVIYAGGRTPKSIGPAWAKAAWRV